MANPISRTAYYTLGVRAADAAKPKPLCGDTLAGRFMNDDAQRVWEEFKGFTAPNASNAARHAMIDAHLRAVLAADPGATIVIIGAGFDTRPFRLAGGRWFEFDEPEILTYKETRLPAASAPNPLVRTPVDFSRDELAKKLEIAGSPAHAHVVVEGVLMYLTRDQRAALLRTLASRFPRHTLYCDLMRKGFFERYSRPIHEKIVGMGATFTELDEQPERLFIEAGYTMTALDSATLHAVNHGSIGIPAFVVRWLLKSLRDGYLVGVFERSATRPPGLGPDLA